MGARVVQAVFHLQAALQMWSAQMWQHMCKCTAEHLACTKHTILQSTQVAGILNGDPQLLGQALDSDVIVEPVRGPLIPGLLAVKEAAKAAGVCVFCLWRC